MTISATLEDSGKAPNFSVPPIGMASDPQRVNMLRKPLNLSDFSPPAYRHLEAAPISVTRVLANGACYYR